MNVQENDLFSKEFVKELTKIKAFLNRLENEITSERETKINIINVRSKIKKLFDNIKENEEEYKVKCAKMREEVTKLVRKINEIEYKHEEVNKKPLIERFYYIAMIGVGLIPYLSAIGLLVLFFYLQELGLDRLFYDIASNANSLIFLFVIASLLFLLFMAPSLYFIYIDINNVQRGNSKNMNIIISPNAWARIFLCFQFFIVFLFSFLGSFVISESFYSIFGAMLWTGLFAVVRYVAINAAKVKDYKAIRLFPFVLIILLFSSMYIFANVVKYLGGEIKLERIFSLVEFSEKQYYWYKLNENFVERARLTEDEINKLKSIFSWENISLPKYSPDSIYLYGRIMVKTSNIKILCAEKNGKLICQDFASSDLLFASWMNSEKSEEKSEYSGEAAIDAAPVDAFR